MLPLLVLLYAWLFGGALWIVTPIRVYSGVGLSPCIYPEFARTDAVRLSPGTYTQGTVLGQVATLTAANDVQTLTFGGTPTGGTFRLSFNGAETGNITFDTTAGGAPLAANIQAALEALSEIGAGNVTVSSSLTVPAVTFQGALAARWQPLLINSVNNMTSGTAATLAIAHTTPGRAVGGEYRAYDDALADGTNIAKCVLQYDTTVTPNGKHYLYGDKTSRADLSAPVYIKGYFRTADLTGIDAAAVADLGRIVEGAISSLTNVATVLVIE